MRSMAPPPIAGFVPAAGSAGNMPGQAGPLDFKPDPELEVQSKSNLHQGPVLFRPVLPETGGGAERAPGGVRWATSGRLRAGFGSGDVLQPPSVRRAAPGRGRGIRVQSSGRDHYTLSDLGVRAGSDPDHGG
ncbi:hypothetical protein DM860_004527 [Cuscuta australis]|uniref:Uncharacterized protein n=1 Tax=Cuscuta australis TaxID=267555 RepID=A0A328E9N5_9ASTE|nr:hypothetical protein DM860_004527 [Cuscuta australis]